jgi:hypothetical protein
VHSQRENPKGVSRVISFSVDVGYNTGLFSSITYFRFLITFVINEERNVSSFPVSIQNVLYLAGESEFGVSYCAEQDNETGFAFPLGG